jgi:hypothetical protein
MVKKKGTTANENQLFCATRRRHGDRKGLLIREEPQTRAPVAEDHLTNRRAREVCLGPDRKPDVTSGVEAYGLISSTRYVL